MPALRRLARVAALALLAGFAPPLRGQTGVQLQGIVDGEFWSTDTQSQQFLTRNDGHPGTVGRAMLWGALEPRAGVVLYAMGEAERGDACREPHQELEQLGLRFTPSSHFVVDVGRFPHLVGAFSSRHFSNRNPLVGEPDIYPIEYPDGVKIGGVARWFDYRVALVDLPVVHPDYSPYPTRTWRPAVALGMTPYVGIRFGVSYSQGTYLNKTDAADTLLSRPWSSYRQRVLGTELSASIGYLELNGELTRPSYDSPANGSHVDGLEYYGEGKYTLTPRLFVAARLERSDYPFVNYNGFTGWLGSRTDFHDEELGAGFRLTSSTLIKTSYRRDHWHNAGKEAFLGPGGHSFAVQLSQSFDVVDWVDRVRNGAR